MTEPNLSDPPVRRIEPDVARVDPDPRATRLTATDREQGRRDVRPPYGPRADVGRLCGRKMEKRRKREHEKMHHATLPRSDRRGVYPLTQT